MSGELAENDGTIPKLGRRALMLGAATGVGAAAALVAGASPARAGTGDGGNVQLGQDNSGATATTYISTTGGDGLDATTSADGSYGVNGESSGSGGIGVLGQDFGSSTSGFGVYGFSNNGGTGVYGISTGSSSVLSGPVAGVWGDSIAQDGVLGTSSDASGVLGVSHSTSGLSLGSAGVWGDSDTHAGVLGTSNTFAGVLGLSNGNGATAVFGVDQSSSGGYGVYGESLAAGGIGVHASNANASGKALEVDGVATFNRSGVATLTAAAASVVVAVPGGLKTTSHVLATLQTNSGTLGVRAAVPNTSTGKVTVYFTGTAPVGTKVAWFVFG